ncbi:MAG: hypothetical protein KGL39_52145, partial [Patescibacteria group bacterium]|nr:hypothetical protein [Patescibacteria group bacterium]
GFGAPPDRFERGFPIRDLPVETCRKILELTPRLGLETAALLRLRIAEKEAEMTPAQKKAGVSRP